MTTTIDNSVYICRPNHEDWQQIPALLKTANFDQIGGPEMYRFLPENAFVAKQQDRVIGVAGYEILDDINAKTTLLVVMPEQRGNKVGSLLQRQRLDFLRKQGVKNVYTNCDDDRVIAWNCREFGFRPTGRLIDKEESYGRNDRSFWTNLRLELDSEAHLMSPVFPSFEGKERVFYDLTDSQTNNELQQAVFKVTDQMKLNRDRYLSGSFKAVDDANERVAENQLNDLLNQNRWVSDIVEKREISNCIPFNFSNVDQAVMDEQLVTLRQELDALMLKYAKEWFPGCPDVTVENTGHFWYPKGSYMGWHTNLRTPGWRCYINVVEEDNRSFFRYRDPADGKIETLWDKKWNIRFFHITPTQPLWHCVYSDTNRFSLGYKFILN